MSRVAKKPLTFFGKKLKADGTMFIGKNVRVRSTGYGLWAAEYENVNADTEVYVEGRNTPEGALLVLENRLRRMRTALNKLIVS